MKRSLFKLLCLILALGMVIGCFAGCDSASGGRDKDDEEESEREDIRDSLEKYELNGLTYYLSDDFADDIDYGDDCNSHSSGDGIEIQITGGPMEDMTDDELNTSEDFAQFFMEFLGDMYDESEIGSKHGTYYVIGISEGVANIMGFYVKDGYGWIIYITNEDGEATDDLIDMVTLGQIDKKFDPSRYISDVDSDYEEKMGIANIHHYFTGDEKIWKDISYWYEQVDDQLYLYIEPQVDVEYIFNTYSAYWGDIRIEHLDSGFLLDYSYYGGEESNWERDLYTIHITNDIPSGTYQWVADEYALTGECFGSAVVEFEID